MKLLGCGFREGEGFFVEFEGECAGGGGSAGEGEGGSGEEAGGAGKAEELGVAVVDSEKLDGFAVRDEGERAAAGGGRGELAGGGGDGVAVGVGLGVAEEVVEAGKDFFRDDVFEGFGFVVDFGPVKVQDTDEEEFNEPVSAEDVEGEFFAAGCEADAAAGLVFNEAGFGEGLDHGGGGSGDDVHGQCELAEGDGAGGGAASAAGGGGGSRWG